MWNHPLANGPKCPMCGGWSIPCMNEYGVRYFECEYCGYRFG